MLICVFGRRGSGKTTMIRAMIPEMKKPVMVIDILGNYTEDSHFVQCDTVEDALTEILRFNRDKKHPGIIVVSGADMSRSVDFICSALWHNHGGTLVVDEADAISWSDAPCFDEAVRYGRNHGIDIITGCRRPAEISKNITAGCDQAYCLTTHEPRDIEYYRGFLGDELAYKLPTLKTYHGICRDFLEQNHYFFKTDVHGRIIKTNSQSRQKPVQPELPLLEPESNDQDILETEDDSE